MLGESLDVRRLLPIRSEDQQQDAEADQETCDMLPNCGWQERILGCATCMVAGYILSLGSFFRMKDLLLGDPLPFVMTGTIGNIIALGGSCFLSGPRSQAKKMWHTTRRVATIVYLSSLVLTLLTAFSPIPSGGLKKLLLLLFMMVQYLAIFWYCLSYIPFARDLVKRWCCNQFYRSNDDGG